MTPISALAILFCIYAVSELIAQKSKAIFSTVLSIAILLLAGFWSGILPRTLIDDAQITGFGNIIAGLLIVSLGTTIDFAELRRQWKVVVTALCGVCGAVAAIVLIGQPFIGSEMAIAGAPIFAGGSAATLIMTSTLKEMNLTTAATFCIVLYVTQKFIGVPIASLLLRRTARLIRDDAVLVEQYSTLQEENAAAHHGPLHLPKCCERPSMYLAKLAVVAVIAYYASKLTGGAVHYFVMCLIMGAVFFALGFLDKSILGKTQASSLITFFVTILIFSNLAQTTPEQVLSVLPALLTAAACAPLGTWDSVVNVAVSFVCALQVEAFRKVHGHAFASTMCTGNLRSGTEALYRCVSEQAPGSVRTAGCYFAVIACFLCGAALGGLLLPVLGQWTVLVAAAEQAAVFVWMWIR